jgi:proline dehydrogenase
MIQGHSNLSFDNTEVAFKSKSNAALRKASLLFKSFDYPITLRLGPTLAKVTVAVGLKSIIKSTIFEQFCGGETIVECNETINKLAQSGIGTILDYSVEGAESDAAFNHTAQEILATIERAAGNSSIPFSVFKITGIVESRLLESVSQGKQLDFADQQKWDAGRQRFFNICEAAAKSDVRLFIDAEESWLQEAIDRLAEEAMLRFNTAKPIIYNTLQMYRHDRLAYLDAQLANTSHFLGFKLVRGAYMEKERKRSLEMGYNDPIQVNKEATDRDYDLAVARCIENSHRVAICIGTHNETSSLKGTALMQAQQMPNQDTRVFFSQLLGMSDHISFNLSHHHYNVAKYVPYGPVSAVIPYLTRRAQENSGMAGQMGRELGLITNELHRRKSK